MNSQQPAICLLAQLVLKISGSLFPGDLDFTSFVAAPLTPVPGTPQGHRGPFPFRRGLRIFWLGLRTPNLSRAAYSMLCTSPQTPQPLAPECWCLRVCPPRAPRGAAGTPAGCRGCRKLMRKDEKPGAEFCSATDFSLNKASLWAGLDLGASGSAFVSRGW